MESPPATATRDGAFLAHVLADALSLGLPDPDYITMHPRYAADATLSAVDFQFNDRNGQEPLPRMHAWAERFGVTVDVSDGESSTWHEFDFTHAGVRFHAYAQIKAPAPDPSIASDEAAAVLAASIDAGTPLAIACAACGQPRYAHHHGDFGSIPGLCDSYDPGALDDAAPEVCGLPVWGDGPACPLFAGHEPMPGCPGDGERLSLRIAGGAS